MKKNNIWFVFSILGQIGLIIAIPVVFLAYFGAKLDKFYHTAPLFILSGMGIALAISSLLIYQMIKRIEEK
ncbi:MAG: AtpZ/AtpI family protein [Patescibacteria group bacterium]|nr:AtpZ/AtpI family protein [Patescibacteria group bacterium]